MRVRTISILVVAGSLACAAVGLAGHVTQVDPATVPTGFLASHSVIRDLPVSPLARAVTPDGADVLVQHVRLGSKAATGWHTHPGPAIVTVVRGSLTYEDVKANACRRATYSAGEGFVDRGFGHVHRAVAGDEGVDFYVTYVLPRGSDNHVIGASTLPECSS